jgi:integrase
MLHAYLALYTYAGLKKHELSKAKIKDVRFNNNGGISGIVTNSQGGNGNFVPLTGFPAQVLKDYLDYLRSSGKHNMSPNSPLFPNYEGKNGERQMNRHLKKVPPFKMGDILQDWNLDKLPEFGMADYYQNEINAGKTQDEAIQNTASQYRVTERTVTDNLAQDKKETQASFDELLKHWDELVTKNKSDQQEIDAFRDEGIRLIDKMRIKDKDKIKEFFNKSIDDFMANLSLSQPHNAINNKNPCDLKLALNNFAKATYNSREEREARKRIKKETEKMERYYFGEDSK